jgi:hypothetical protein
VFAGYCYQWAATGILALAALRQQLLAGADFSRVRRGNGLNHPIPIPLDPVPKPPPPEPSLPGWQDMLSPWPDGVPGGPGTAARTDSGAGGAVDASGANSLFGHDDIQHDLNTLRQQLVTMGITAYTPEGKQQILTLLQAFLNAAGTRLQTSDANVPH